MNLDELFDATRNQIELERIFVPRTRRERDKVFGNVENPKFVHYTSAENALKIIESRRLWMRNSGAMSDYSEIRHGFEILHELFNENEQLISRNFTQALKPFLRGEGDPIRLLFDNSHHINPNIYISSLSLHQEKENYNGRLSMWRAFGGNGGRIAFVLNIPRNSGIASRLGLNFSPVSYLQKNEIKDDLNEIIKNLGNPQNQDFLMNWPTENILDYAFYALYECLACVKHQGFSEELEWRAIYCPTLRKTDVMENERQTISINGIPQIIYKIPLDVRVDKTFADLDFFKILDHIIIGPTPYSLQIKQALVYALEKAGAPKKDIHISGIPIR